MRSTRRWLGSSTTVGFPQKHEIKCYGLRTALCHAVISHSFATATEMAPIRCLILAGCTGVGKSSLSMRIAGIRPAEIISADSVAVYRGLNIGSAKPSRLWQRSVQHHLIDIADPELSPTHPYTAADFSRDAHHAIRSISERGNLPIICGGSGMYLSFLIDGHDQYHGAKQRPDSVTTNMVQYALATYNWTEAINWIAQRLSIDPGPLLQVQYGNQRRLVRTVYRVRHAATECSTTAATPPSDIDFRIVTLVRSRPSLYRDIDRRCEHMLQRGLLDEVVGLYGAGKLPPGSPPALSVGYRQALAYLDTFQGKFDLAGFRRFLDDFQTASRQLARRQLTWFRQNPAFRFMDVDEATSEDVLARVLSQLDLDRTAYDDLATNKEFCDLQTQLRTLSDDDRNQQRRYISEPAIFKYGMSEDVILKLMAQDPNTIGAL